MPGFDLTEQLPPEVLLQVFDWLFLPELARIVTVSRRWWAIVVDHPTYFAHPVLDDPSPSAVAFFLARFNLPRKPWDVWVMVREPFPLLETCIFPTIAAHLDVVEALTLHVHMSHTQAVFDLLRYSAPALSCLQLFFSAGSEDHAAVALPEDILPHQPAACILRTLLLDNVALGPRIPVSLTRTRHLVIGNNVPNSATCLHDVARAFPAIRRLTLNENVLADTIDSSAWPPQWNYLESLTLSVPRRRLRHVIGALPLARIAHLTTMHTGNRAIPLVLLHLHGGLDLSVQDYDGDRFLIHLTSRQSGLVRSFYELRESWAGPRPPHRLLSYKSVMERVVSLIMPVALWNILVPQMSECTGLKNITLLLPGSVWRSRLFSEHAPPPRPIFPGLRTLTLVGEYGISVVTPQDVSRILLERLLPQSPLRLYIHNVTWTGSTHTSPEIDSIHLLASIDIGKLFPQAPWPV